MLWEVFPFPFVPLYPKASQHFIRATVVEPYFILGFRGFPVTGVRIAQWERVRWNGEDRGGRLNWQQLHVQVRNKAFCNVRVGLHSVKGRPLSRSNQQQPQASVICLVWSRLKEEKQCVIFRFYKQSKRKKAPLRCVLRERSAVSWR